MLKVHSLSESVSNFVRPRIGIDHLSHSFGEIAVLKEISLEICLGEIVALLGPSGCGKTTLLHLIGGILSPSGGAISLGFEPHRFQSIAYIFQDPLLLPWLTAAGNVALPLDKLRISPGKRDSLVAEALAQVNLSKFAQIYPKSLSGGMKQRVSIARALVVRPAVLLMDEPFASLDEMTREGVVLDLIRRWQTTPFTCLYVTHNPSEAVRIAHRVVILTARPARAREIIPIDLDIDKRTESHPIIVHARKRIWELIRTPS